LRAIANRSIVRSMSTQIDQPALTADQIVEAMKDTDWKYPVEIDTEPRRKVVGVKIEEREGNPAFRIVLETQPL
jgi:hypothetical protein